MLTTSINPLLLETLLIYSPLDVQGGFVFECKFKTTGESPYYILIVTTHLVLFLLTIVSL